MTRKTVVRGYLRDKRKCNLFAVTYIWRTTLQSNQVKILCIVRKVRENCLKKSDIFLTQPVLKHTDFNSSKNKLTNVPVSYNHTGATLSCRRIKHNFQFVIMIYSKLNHSEPYKLRLHRNILKVSTSTVLKGKGLS